MNTSTLISSLMLLGAAIGVLGTLTVLVARSFPSFQSKIPNVRAVPERRKLAQREALLHQADPLIKAGDLNASLPLLRRALYLEQIRHDAELVDDVHAHHLALLERVLTITEAAQDRLPQLPVIEDLFATRAELNKSYFDLMASQASIIRKSKEKGRKVPDWAISEYRTKLDDMADRMQTNERSLASQLDDLFKSLEKLPSGDASMTYH